MQGYLAQGLALESHSRPLSLPGGQGLTSSQAEEDAALEEEEVVPILSGSASAPQLDQAPDQTPHQNGQWELPVGWLPERNLFSALLADPRWLHFSASYDYYINDEDLRPGGAISLGEVFSLYRLHGPFAGQSEVGLQAGVFAIFDLDADSHDLINADYWVALHGCYRREQFSAMARVYHQSSHLGDAFLLRGGVDRVDLSLEGTDLRLSYELIHGFRLYGGGGFIFNQKDTDIKPWSTQVGIEFRSPWAFGKGLIRPVGGVDVKNHQEHGWRADFSVRAGIQFDSVQVLGRNLQLLLQYYDGYSPDGQFYKIKIQYLGAGIHFYF